MEESGVRTFAIGSCLGRGGFGEVYRARMRSPGGLDSEVAVKVLRADVDPDTQSVQRLRDEARVLARLDHPVILRVHDLVRLDGRVALIAEYVEGEDLDTCVRGDGRMPVRALLESVAAVAGALHAAWEATDPEGRPLRLVHRDIKPSNIRISKHGHVKLLDFGIARSDQMSREARTQTDMVVGSPHYLAPERFLSADVDPASDVFALGCVLYEGLVGVRLYEDVSVLMMSAAALDPDRHGVFLTERLRRLPPGLDERLVGLLVALLAHEPSARPSAIEVADRCERLVDQLGGIRISAWARSRVWRAPEPVNGPLEGQTLTEGTTLRAFAKDEERGRVSGTMGAPRPTDLGTSAGLARGGLAVAAAGSALLVVGVIVAVVLVGCLGWWYWPRTTEVSATVAELPRLEREAPSAAEEPLVPVETVAVAPPPTPELQELAFAASEPPPARGNTPSEPRIEAPAPAAEPTRVLVPAAAPAPVETPPAAPEPPRPPAGARLDFSGADGVSLVRDGDRVSLPGIVPPGEWTVEAAFAGRAPQTAGRVVVRAGDERSLACSARMLRCELR